MQQPPSAGRRAAAARALAAPVLAVVVTACSAPEPPDPDPAQAPAPGAAAQVTAELLTRVTSVHEETGMTLLEGPVLAPDGGLLVVDVTAPEGEPKVLRVDTGSGEVETVFTEGDGAYTSAQFSPSDGRLYLTDFAGGRIDSLTADGEDHTTFFSGEVDGAVMRPDDLAFDEDGNLYVSDSTGFDGPVWEARGRVVRIDGETAEATVLARDLPAPNGISFTEDFTGLWVSQYAANRVDHLALDGDGTAVETAHTALHFNGGTSRVDSNAIDAAGNLYQAVHGRPGILVYSPLGEHLATVEVPADDAEGLDSATNVAIAPGETDAYMTVSGRDGGFVYTFEALAEGIRQSNGG
ncbi:SMP-30/gluconolactonase/LRE family protein [Nocardiopsis changdeensis]|uniref:SMP-30/gluconolactonase/LRE family protein n=1 Tax=Nocardiopsis changdeensis TaxID=2831969 RepID=A0ABX8BEQ2_9ACTN|nr:MULTISPECIES: SMP-30/gluconolactonase/LRE family protein [Nocardiopsis]QUX20529.1 SMP-30/gluconolactonase/LRE family protein [Nocardiopsis changdeensis]QYX36460.1 SMP-30/gluconolactonase/LRE family protein [Nocardiopsis sp. MT53]